MLGAGEEWFYRGLLGINVDMSQPHGEQLQIKPQIVDVLEWVRGTYDSALGPVASAWHHDGAKVTLEITTPVAAIVRVPLRVGDVAHVGAGDASATLLRVDADAAIYRVKAGAHSFVVAPKQ